MAEQTVYNALPKLPGFHFAELHPPPTNRRHQLCFIRNGQRTVLEPSTLTRNGKGSKRKGECGGLTRAEIFEKFPDWKSMDDKTLRFFGYYMERVDESHIETERVRKVKFYFYLTDGTLSIVETPAVINSGLRRGTTVSRCKIPGIDVFTLCVGSILDIRGIEYTIVDCDAATRDFCEAMGIPQSGPLDYPYDAFEATMSQKQTTIDEHHIAMRRAMEMTAAVAAGTHASLLTPDERTKARNFFIHDREVLRFHAVWNHQLFRIQYYIADKTLSVMLEHPPNDGRDPNPVFIRRTLVPLDPAAALRDTETLNVPLGLPIQYVTDNDLRTGETINLFARDFYIFDCDPYTRSYYKEKGINQPVFPKPPTEGDLPVVPEKTKKRTDKSLQGTQGASSMIFEDSVGHKDRLKLTRFPNDVFRFAACHVNPKSYDEGRKFVISYHLADDTVSVFEIVVANSGHIGGRAFSRSVVPNIDEPNKLFVGATVTLAGVEYKLIEMDERTKKYIEMGMPFMDENYFHTQDLIGRAQQSVLQRFSRLTDAFRHFRSSSTSEGLSCTDVKQLFIECGIRLDEKELESVMESLDKDKDQIVSLPEFVENFLGQQLVSDFNPKNEKGCGVMQGPIRSLRSIREKQAAAKEGDEALRRLISLCEARRVLLIRACRTTANSTYDGHLGIEDFRTTLEKLNLNFTEDEMNSLIYKVYYIPGLPDWTARRLPLNEIRRFVNL